MVVSDVMMPGMDGLTLARTLRERPDAPPVVLVSAKAADTDRVAGLEVAQAYLTKPVRMRELLDTVASLAGITLEEPAEALSAADQRLLDKLAEVMTAHLAEEGFGVAELARAMGQSPRQLQRTLRRLTQLSPSRYLRRARMEAAHQRQLAGEFTTTAEVAQSVGLSPAYFSRLYSKWFGRPPSTDLHSSV